MVDGAFLFVKKKTLLCETVLAKTLAELRVARDSVVDADMVELRLDGVSDPDIAGALAGRRLPIIVTCRPTWEGGLFDGSEEERQKLLEEALRQGAEYVDVEHQSRFSDAMIAEGGDRILLSMHDFDGVPSDLNQRVRNMRSRGAAIIKIAVTTKNLSDTVPLRDIAVEAPTVVVGMGSSGLPTRVLASRFGSRWTYSGNGFAPGQISTSRMLDEFCFRQISSDTSVYGVVGKPVINSLSPVIHNAAFKDLGLNSVYLPLQAESLEDFLTFAKFIRIEGASVTIPYKREALRCAEKIDSLAQSVGAINTLRKTSMGWIGINTDIDGFLAPLVKKVKNTSGDLKGIRASVLGAGGAARAVVAGLALKGARVTVHARKTDSARELSDSFNVQNGQWPPHSGSWDILVNCTPLGSHGEVDKSPMQGSKLDGKLVYDLVYSPQETLLMREARAAGCEVIGGLDMLIEQARQQFLWWTGREPSVDLMVKAVGKRLDVQ